MEQTLNGAGGCDSAPSRTLAGSISSSQGGTWRPAAPRNYLGVFPKSVTPGRVPDLCLRDLCSRQAPQVILQEPDHSGSTGGDGCVTSAGALALSGPQFSSLGASELPALARGELWDKQAVICRR